MAEATPCEDTREDFGLSFFTSLHRVLLQGGFYTVSSGPSGLMRACERSRRKHAPLRRRNCVRPCWSAKGMRLPTPGREKRAGTPCKGDQPQNWRVTGPRTGQVPRDFLTLTGLFLQCVGGRWCGTLYTIHRYILALF